MRKTISWFLGLLLIFSLSFSQVERSERRQTLLPLSILQEIIDEAAGELVWQNEVYLTAINRNRPPHEYTGGYFETRFILEKLREYRIAQAEIIELPTRSKTSWDAEMAELCMTKPGRQKLSDLQEVPATLCSGSMSTNVTAGLVYVGPVTATASMQVKKLKEKLSWSTVHLKGPGC